MEKRIAKLEGSVKELAMELDQTKVALKKVIYAMIAAVFGLAALAAKGFGWL